jgi:hypothetical protein
MQYLIEYKSRQWTVLTMGTGVLDSDRASVNGHATSVRDAQAGFFLLLRSNQPGLKRQKQRSNLNVPQTARTRMASCSCQTGL